MVPFVSGELRLIRWKFNFLLQKTKKKIKKLGYAFIYGNILSVPEVDSFNEKDDKSLIILQFTQ